MDDRNKFEPFNRFIGDIDNGLRYPYGTYLKSETYNKQEVDEKIKNVEVDAYTKAETDSKFATSEDLRELGEETAQQLADFDNEKADKTEVYTKAEVDEKIENNNLGLIVQNGLLCVKYESEGV